jgi:endonuclease YncB( thermonuclease family)
MNRFIILILITLFCQKTYAIEIIGFSKIIDGDTIHISSNKIRLEGIDAPEMKQKCKKSQKEYFCGIVSQIKLKEKINNNQVKCISSSKDKYQRYIAICFIKDINLNKWMVRNGYAISYKRYSKKYVPDEDFAKRNKLGVWSGFFMEPEKWRKLN